MTHKSQHAHEKIGEQMPCPSAAQQVIQRAKQKGEQEGKQKGG
jgi:flagellar biosynthesis/type III secretory pathway protein FliH